MRTLGSVLVLAILWIISLLPASVFAQANLPVTRNGVTHLEREVSPFNRMLKGITLVLAPVKV